MTHNRGKSLASRVWQILAWSALAILPGPLLAADFAAPSPLSRVVPADVGLCLEIQNLAEHSSQFLDSELYRRLRDYPALRRWSDENRPQLTAIADEVERRLGARPVDAWNKLLGRQALLAVWPPPGGGDEGSALLLVEVADSQLLARLLDRLVSAQREAGKWKATRQLEVAGQVVQLHVLETEPQKSGLFLAAVGELGIMATSEQIVRDVVALSQATPRGPSALAGVPAYAEGIGRLAPMATGRLFINPRIWDEHLLADLRSKPAGSSDAEAQLVVVETWRATDYLVVGVELGPRLAIEAYAKWDRAKLPEAVGTFVDSVGGQAELLDRVPADALVVLAGRIDLGALLGRFGRPAATRNDAASSSVAEPPTGWFALVALAGSVGPDFVSYIAPRRSDSTGLRSTAEPTSPGESPPASAGNSPNAAAIDWVVGFATRPLSPANPETRLADVLAPLARSTMEIMAATANARSGNAASHVKTTQVDGLVLTSIVGFESAYPAAGPLAASLEATFAVVGDAFWVGTSPAAVQRAATVRPEQSLSHRPAVARQVGRSASGGPRPGHFLYVNLAGLGQWMAQSPGLVDYLAKSKGLDHATAQRSWNELVALASLADSLIATVALGDSGAAASLSLTAE
ncbi:MAG: hypothetical protein WD847_18155 [Pirellulales bacterium]